MTVYTGHPEIDALLLAAYGAACFGLGWIIRGIEFPKKPKPDLFASRDDWGM